MINQNQNAFLQLIEEFPANKLLWSKTQILTLIEALFISYGVEPPNENNSILMLNFHLFLTQVDSYHIYELSKRAVVAGNLPKYDNNYVKAVDFVSWARENEIPIRTEYFFCPASLPGEEKKDGGDSVERRPKAESLRKNIFRDAAQLHWRKEEQNPKNKLKEYARPADLARSKDMADLANLINRIGGLTPIQGSEYSENGVDPEWFSDLYPGKTKPGPKPQSKKKGS